MNRNKTGWVVEVVNNRGVYKTGGEPAVVDEEAVTEVTLRPRMEWTQARRWGSEQQWSSGQEVKVTVGPGETVFVEFVEARN